ncbi:MAG TPA: MlaD family protein [Steroidobacteraceae bacterium]|jgi:paraquat-inducible protein B|nr:MlaD family protein [Steroidobacteraceae bacterium]
MSAPEGETDARGEVPLTGRRRTVWPNLIWGIPIAALLIVGYLGVKALFNRGEVVTVTFSRAAGARAGMTKVLYQGVEAGRLLKIEPNADGRRLDFILRLVPAAKSGLNTNARFWLIGANPNFSDLSSLKAVVSGIAIGYAPGEGGEPTDRFEGLEQAPLILPGDKGTRYALRAHALNSIHEGSIVQFHGQAIGKVIEIRFDGDRGFRLQAFIDQPYDSLIRPGARFWKISPLRLSFAGGGITANLAPLTTLLAGGIDLEVEATNLHDPQSPADTEFTLYSSHNAARQGLSGPTVRYEFAFAGDAGVLDETSAVTLLGFQIGEVESTRLAYDERTGAPYALATALLYPQQMRLESVASAQGASYDWRAATDAALARLIHLGYRARLQQSPPVLGEESIQLVRMAGAPAAQLVTDGGNPRFPSAPGSSNLDDIAAKADIFLNKLDAVPLEDIGSDLRKITGNLDKLMSSPELKDSLTHLHSTLISIDKLLGDVRPQIGPLIGKLHDAAAELSGTAAALRQVVESGGPDADASLPDAIRQITEAARSIKTLTDYLDRHPEALIRGKRPEK